MRTVALIASLIGALLTASPSAHAAEEHYVFDPVHTNILFFISHLGFSRMQGEFHTYSGGFDFDAEDPVKSKVSVTIDTDSIDTDYKKLDDHLKSADFFDVAKYPTMTFTSTSIERTGEKTAKITGDLTLHGVTKPVTLTTTFNAAGVHPVSGKHIAGFSAVATLKRSDFGMTYGLPAIGDTVEIVLEVEGVRQ